MVSALDSVSRRPRFLGPAEIIALCRTELFSSPGKISILNPLKKLVADHFCHDRTLTALYARFVGEKFRESA